MQFYFVNAYYKLSLAKLKSMKNMHVSMCFQPSVEGKEKKRLGPSLEGLEGP